MSLIKAAEVVNKASKNASTANPIAPSHVATPFQTLWRNLFGGRNTKTIRANGANGANAAANSASNASTSLGVVFYDELKSHLEQVMQFRQTSHAARGSGFSRRVAQLDEIDHRVDALTAELFKPDIAQDWRANPGLCSAFGHRLAQISMQLASAYRDLLDEGRRKYPSGSKNALSLPRLVCRSMMHLGLSMRWNSYASKREVSSSWGRLYRLYRFAEKRGILREKVEVGEKISTTCYREFACILLYGLGEPAALSPIMSDVAYAWCGEWSELIEFTIADHAEGEQHCFDMDASLPPSQFHPQMRSDQMRCFSTAAVCFKVAAMRERTPNNTNNKNSAAADLSNVRRDDLIRHLLAGWVKANPARRVERASEGLKVAHVACGVDAINELLFAETHPNAGIPPEFSIEHWSIENESLRGYGLQKRKISEDPEAGKLVCLRANGSPIWQVGVVRWERNAETGEPQLGIETLANNPKVVHVMLPRGHDADAALPAENQQPSGDLRTFVSSVGIATKFSKSEVLGLARRASDKTGADDNLAANLASPANEVIKALLLPKDTKRGNAHSLIISGKTFAVGTLLNISSEKVKFWVRLSGVINHTDDWSQMSFSVVSNA